MRIFSLSVLLCVLCVVLLLLLPLFLRHHRRAHCSRFRLLSSFTGYSPLWMILLLRLFFSRLFPVHSLLVPCSHFPSVHCVATCMHCMSAREIHRYSILCENIQGAICAPYSSSIYICILQIRPAQESGQNYSISVRSSNSQRYSKCPATHPKSITSLASNQLDATRLFIANASTTAASKLKISNWQPI